MFSKTETKYKRKSERTKLNSNWNENDFKTKMVTYNVKKQAFQSRVTRHQQQHQTSSSTATLSTPASTSPSQHWNDSSFCRGQINFSSLYQQTTRVTLAVLVLVLRCKPTLTSTCMNFWQLCRRSCHYLLEWSRRQAAYPLLAHWPKTLHPRPTWSMCSPYVNGLQLAAETDCLKIWCVYETEQRLGVTVWLSKE